MIHPRRTRSCGEMRASWRPTSSARANSQSALITQALDDRADILLYAHVEASESGLGPGRTAGAYSEVRGVTRTEFVLRASEAAAIETLNERPVIALDEAYDAFLAALDAPAEPERFERALRAQAAVGEITRPGSGITTQGANPARCLDAWMKSRSRLNEAKGGARTMSSLIEPRGRLGGEQGFLPGRSMPEPIPVILLGQLGGFEYQGRGLGSESWTMPESPGGRPTSSAHAPSCLEGARSILRALRFRVLGRTAHAAASDIGVENVFGGSNPIDE